MLPIILNVPPRASRTRPRFPTHPALSAKIFNNIEDGTPVLIFGQNTWYQPGSADSPATKNPLRGTTAQPG